MTLGPPGWQTHHCTSARVSPFAARKPSTSSRMYWLTTVGTFASRTMRWGGLLLLVFIVVHVLHFTTRSFPGYDRLDATGSVDIYHNLMTAFSNPWWVLFYLVSMAALALHLYHGAWSSMRTLGASKPSAHPLKRVLPLLIAIVVAGGFVVIPLAVLSGVLR